MIKVTILGPTTVSVDGGTISAAELGGRPRQILEILALDPGTAMPKERLADLLWDGEPPSSYIGTLESYVCVLRRKLGLGTGRGSVLATAPSGYVLDASAVDTDRASFHRLVGADPSASAADVVARTMQAMELVRGELLADERYAAWATRARDIFERELVAAAVRAAQLANAIGDFASALHLARTAVAHDSLCEDAWQHLMRALWFSGHRLDALRAYAELRSAMLDGLGDEPGVPSQELYLAILRDRPAADGGDAAAELRTLMTLMRQTLDLMPGVDVPARDSALTTVAVKVLDLTDATVAEGASSAWAGLATA
jgi:DNA-binding SARP family transcriptional activator